MKVIHSFSSYSVKDVNSALKFYTEKLGLTAKIDEKMGIMDISLPDGAHAMLYPKGDEHKAANFTVLNLLVDEIELAVDELTAKGVKIEHYDNEHMKTDEKGIAQTGDGDSPKIAWFTDQDGNILSLIENDENRK